MASRLALKYGLVAEEDRLSSSSDALVVTEPTTGSKARTKGSLYLIVTSRVTGGRTRDACRLVAETIGREYYYDESAGIPIVLEKAVRAANRRLRQSREGGGLAAYSIGIALAVVRGNELYVATCGDANAYLIRSARLLMPEHQSGVGLPAADNLNVGVWRGEFAVGDSLVLTSRNLVEVVGSEELKNAVVTLHPQSAVEHLHHLFVAAGGDGSDAVLALEATEVSLARVEHRLVPVAPEEPLAGAPDRSPIPLADHVAGAASAVRERAGAARARFGEGMAGTISRLLDLMPRRRTPYRRVRNTSDARDNQRRVAVAAVALVLVVAVLGLAVWYLGPFRTDNPVDRTTEGEVALAAAAEKVGQVEDGDLIEEDPDQARTLLEDAWDDLQDARPGVGETAWNAVYADVAGGLEEIYATRELAGTQIYAPPGGAEVRGLVRGPDDAAYAIVAEGVVRVDPATGASATVIVAGEGTAQGIGQPRLLARGGPDLLVVDDAGALWRWRPSDDQGAGTLGEVRVAGEESWTQVTDVETFVINADQGLYRMYVPYPPTSQILRYEPTADGSGFLAPAPYFVGATEDVSGVRQLLIDGDVYAVTDPAVVRYFNGRRTGYTLDDPPDAANMRPEHQYRLLDATGTRGVGELFVWDALWSRLLVYDKAEGTYVEQFIAGEDAPPLTDVRGMYIVDRGNVEPPVLVWARPTGVYQAVLSAQPASAPPSPGASGAPATGPSAPASVRPSPSASTPPASLDPSETAPPTERPRRTPRGGVAPTASPGP